MQSFFQTGTESEPAIRHLGRSEPATTVGPWKQVCVRAVGGLTAVGFERNSNLMLVCSTSGQSVIDSATGTVLYRNREVDGLDISALKGTRLDHPADERFDMAGLYGGGLRKVTEDGWSVEQTEKLCLLHPPRPNGRLRSREGHTLLQDQTPALLHRSGGDLRAFGFSWTSQTLVVATETTLLLWHRPTPLRL